MMKLRQQFEPWRQFLFSALILFTMSMVMTACSSEEDANVDEESGDIKLNLSLLNENGKETTIFKEGECVCFDLEIVNNGNSDFVYCLGFDGGDLVLDNDFFCVYTEKGDRIGTPWTGMFCEMSLQKEWHISAKTTHHVRCSWLSSSIFTTTHPLCKFEASPYLAPGVYKTTFDIKYRTSSNATKLTNKKFNVKFRVEK
ncbi:MAG: hypothetical protein IJ698_07745 [Prevotella sp.]|nr:hypothetical protein [Prevotella sp.]